MKLAALTTLLLLSAHAFGADGDCENAHRAPQSWAYHPPLGAVVTQESIVYSAPMSGCETKTVVSVGKSLVVYSEAGEWLQVVSFAEEDSYPEVDGWILKKNTRETGTMGATYK